MFVYDLSRFKDALEIRVLLARLIYDLFHYDRRHDSAKIVLDQPYNLSTLHYRTVDSSFHH